MNCLAPNLFEIVLNEYRQLKAHFIFATSKSVFIQHILLPHISMAISSIPGGLQGFTS